MINEEKMKELRANDPQKMAYLVSRKYGEKVDGYFDIFKTINDLDIRITLANYGIKENGEPLECCQFVPRSNNERGYIVLSNCLSIQRLRFNSAIMLYCAINNTKIETYQRGSSEKSFRQAKLFAVNLLMPEKDLMDYVFKKDKNGKYLFLNENGEISLDNINYIAAHFGTPYKTTAARILNVINNIEGVKTKEELNVAIENRKYVQVLDEKSKKEVSAMYAQLINSLRYLKVDKTKAITLEKVLRECVKNEALLDGVIKDTKGVNYLLQIFAKGGYIDEHGYLHGKNLDKPILLSENQLVVLGNYELLKNIAYEGAAYYTNDNLELVDRSINNAGYGLSKKEVKEELKEVGLKYLSGEMTYKQMETLLTNKIKMNNREIEQFTKELIGFDHYTIRRFHKTLFKYSVEQEHIKGNYRVTKNMVPGANFDTAEVSEIQYAMQDLNYDIIDLLKEKDELSYSEYVNKVNEIVARFIRIHPFEDGNGRVSRAITNFLYKKKSLPFVFINADNQRDTYLSALKQINFDDIKYKKPNVDLIDINLVMYKAIKTSYSNIHEGSKMITNPEKEIARNRLIRGRK